MRFLLPVFFGIAAISFPAAGLMAQDVASTEQEQKETNDAQAELFKSFAERLSDTSWLGRFSVDDKEELMQEEYQLKRVTKLPQGDYWLFPTRIRYGDHDVTVPLPLQVKWAESTPVITLDNVTIPGLGTFSARVVISGERYAGTWQHGDVGGHLFGEIRKTKAAEESTSKAE